MPGSWRMSQRVESVSGVSLVVCGAACCVAEDGVGREDVLESRVGRGVL